MAAIPPICTTAMSEPLLPADEYPDEFAKVKAFLRTAICHDIESAIHFAFICTVPHGDKDEYLRWAIRPTTDVSALASAGLIAADEQAAQHFLMPLGVRESLLHQLSGSPTLLSVFTKIINDLDRVQPPLTPTGTLVSQERECYTFQAMAVAKTYGTHLLATIPWPADKRSPDYVSRVRTLRRARAILVYTAWYKMGTGQWVGAQNLLAQAMNLTHVPEVMGWKSESRWEEQGYDILSVDMCVATAHVFAKQEIVPFSTSRLYWKLRRDWPEVVQPAPGVEPVESPQQMIAFAFKKIFQLMPGVLGVALPQGMQQRGDVEKLVALAWIDGRWHNRLSILTVGVW